MVSVFIKTNKEMMMREHMCGYKKDDEFKLHFVDAETPADAMAACEAKVGCAPAWVSTIPQGYAKLKDKTSQARTEYVSMQIEAHGWRKPRPKTGPFVGSLWRSIDYKDKEERARMPIVEIVELPLLRPTRHRVIRAVLYQAGDVRVAMGRASFLRVFEQVHPD